MKASQLRNAVLQLAIQGKLVPQNPNDEPASVLLEKIKFEKEKLIKEGKIKKEKPLPPITDEEKSFDIPESWEWARLSLIVSLTDGIKFSGVNYPYLEAKYLRGKCEPTLVSNGKLVTKGSLIILVDGENSGEVFEVNEDGCLGSTFKILEFCKSISKGYLIFFIYFYKSLFKNTKIGAAIPHLNKNLFKEIPFPLPPLAEQERIVAKIEEIMPKIDEYEKLEQELSSLEKGFPDKLKKSILQYAVQGKFVEQNPSDEPAGELIKNIKEEKEKLIKEGKIKREKPLLPISEEEIPYELPLGWEWVRLGDIIKITSGDGLTSANMDKDGTVPVYGGNGINGYHSKSNVSEPTIVIGRVGFYCGSIHLTKEKAWVTDNAFITSFSKSNVYRDFLIWLLKATDLRKNDSATAQPVISGQKIYPILVGLPPLTEQKCIVEKVDQFMAMCDELVKCGE